MPLALTPQEVAESLWRLTPAGYIAKFEPTWSTPPHIKLISRELSDAVARAKANNTVERLIVTLPPRHAKSETVSHYGSLWYLDLFPEDKVLLASYEATFASEWGWKVRESIIRHAADLRVRIDPSFGSRSAWYTTAGGGMFTAGIGGSFTGRGATGLFLIDDPFKNFAEAHSEVNRQAVWDWYLSTAFTRLEPGCVVVVVMCMTGDTPVLRPDGSETPLRDIRPGDEIATYEDGAVTTATVRRWANQGPDTIYRIRMKSGRTVRANARHPFLTVDENGAETWVRLESLKAGMSVRSVEAPTPESPVPLRAATNPQGARGCACRTTKKRDGRRGTDRLPLATRHDEQFAFADATESPSRTTTDCSVIKAVDAPSADNALARSNDRSTGPRFSALTTTTTPEPCAACFATTATSSSPERTPPTPCEQPSPTWSVSTDEIVEITEVGVEDVFDIQVDRTENFIANGLAAHNTRWHEDDLVGRLVRHGEQIGQPWHVLNIPAMAEAVGDPLGRAEGEVIWPEFRTPEFMQSIKDSVGPYLWAGMYQQQPAPAAGGILQREWWRFYREMPRRDWFDEIIQSWDMAFKALDDSDFVVGQVWGRIGADKYLLHQHRGRLSFPETVDAVLEVTRLWPQSRAKLVEDAANGPAVIAQLKERVPGLIAVPAKGSKESRAHAVAPDVRAGNVYLPHPDVVPWVETFLHETTAFPNGSNDDQVDACTQALIELGAADAGGFGVDYRDDRLAGRR